MGELQVLFVCTANIARSPYAERRLVQLLGNGSPVSVASAGIPGYADRAMDLEMRSRLEERGGSADGHVSRELDAQIADAADLILVMQFSHHMAILDEFVGVRRKVFGLNQFADAAERYEESFSAAARAVAPETVQGRVDEVAQLAVRNSMTFDVADPYRRGTKASQVCAEEIDAALFRIVPVLTGSPTKEAS